MVSYVLIVDLCTCLYLVIPWYSHEIHEKPMKISMKKTLFPWNPPSSAALPTSAEASAGSPFRCGLVSSTSSLPDKNMEKNRELMHFSGEFRGKPMKKKTYDAWDFVVKIWFKKKHIKHSAKNSNNESEIVISLGRNRDIKWHNWEYRWAIKHWDETWNHE